MGGSRGFHSRKWEVSAPATLESATVVIIVQCRVEHRFVARLVFYACEVLHERRQVPAADPIMSDCTGR